MRTKLLLSILVLSLTYAGCIFPIPAGKIKTPSLAWGNVEWSVWDENGKREGKITNLVSSTGDIHSTLKLTNVILATTQGDKTANINFDFWANSAKEITKVQVTLNEQKGSVLNVTTLATPEGQSLRKLGNWALGLPSGKLNAKNLDSAVGETLREWHCQQTQFPK